MNELSVGYRHSTEAGSALDQDGPRRRDALAASATRSGQFTPRSTRSDIIPTASFTGAIQNPAAITFEGRFPLTGADTFFTVNDTASLRARHRTPSRPASTWSTPATRKARPAPFAGDFEFNVDTTNPFDTRHPYANALLGVFRSYTESSARPGGDGTADVLEWFAQDTWKASREADARFRRRASRWYTHWVQKDGRRRRSRSSGTIRAKAPQLYQPVLVNGVRVARTR